MHELAVCRSLLDEVERVAVLHGARRVERVLVAIGPLAGIDSGLLGRAFEVARAGTIAAEAAFAVETMPVVVRCAACEVDSTVPANAMLCARCGDWRVELLSGDELLLKSVELELESRPQPQRPAAA
ncbi:MAG: hydrogenase maturation nickel metallochaperone HypA [Gammaproteobacteria bacterium]|nr:hydrogenase maturation nickel metallochaperone HypA [Gammaproteobacteria bacterium]